MRPYEFYRVTFAVRGTAEVVVQAVDVEDAKDEAFGRVDNSHVDVDRYDFVDVELLD